MTRYELYSTGSNSHGQLGLGSDDDYSTYTRIALASHSQPRQLALGANHTLLIAEIDGRWKLLGSGSNAEGQLGRGSTNPRLSFEEIRWQQYVPDDLADEAEDDYSIQGIYSSWSTSFVHLRPRRLEEDKGIVETRSDILVSFGSNDWGERGRGEGCHSNPTVVSFSSLVDGPYRISRLTAGPRHILAILEPLSPKSTSTATLVGWGASRQGQLGSDDSVSKLPRMFIVPQAVPLPEPFSASEIIYFSCGKDHSAILIHPSEISTESVLLLLGSNKHRQLGPLPPDSPSHLRTNILPLTSTRPDAPFDTLTSSVDTTWNSTFLTLSPKIASNLFPSDLTDTSIIAFGSDSHGQLGNGKIIPPSLPADNPLRTIRFSSSSSSLCLCAGSEHLIALVNNSTSQQVYSWGWNEHGNLGLGQDDLKDRGEPARVETIERLLREKAAVVEGIWAGMATSWISIAYDKQGEKSS